MKHIRIYYWACIWLLVSNYAISQTDNYVDSLIQTLSYAKEDTNKLNTLNLIAENGSDKIWPIYNNEMGKLAAKLQSHTNEQVKLKAKRFLAASLNNKGVYFSSLGNAHKAILFFKKGLAIQQQTNDKDGEAYTLSNLGTVYDSKGDFKNALDCYFASVRIREKLNSKNSLAQSYNNIAVLYSNQNDIENAIKYHKQSIALRHELKDDIGLGLAYNNVGTAYTHYIENLRTNKKRFPDSLMKVALFNFNKGYECYNKAKSKRGIALSLFNIADHNVLQIDCYYQQPSTTHDTLLHKAELYFEHSLALFKEYDEKEWIANATNGLANVYLREEKIPKAKLNAEKAMVMALELGYPGTIQKSAELLSKIYQQTNEYEKALDMTNLLYSMRDSVVNSKNLQNVLSKNFLYQAEKQELLHKTNQEKMALEFSAKSKQQRIIIYFGIAGLVVLIVFASFMYNRFKITSKQNKIIQYQKQIVEESKKEIVDSINYAERIQKGLLQQDELLQKNLEDYFIFFQPKDIVSGDFYWSTKISKIQAEFGKKIPSKLCDLFYLAVCDSTGHGVPGAFMSLLNMSFLSEAINEREITKPNEVFNYMRERLIKMISSDGGKDGMDSILLCVNKTLQTVTYSAAHNNPILIRNNEIIELPKDKMPVGKGEKTDSFTLHHIDTKPNDIIYLFTDGYADQFGGAKGKKFKYKQLNELLLNIHQLPLTQQQEALQQTFKQWRGNLEQVDDVLIIGIKIGF